MFTQNDYKILQSIMNEEDKTKGVIMTNGTTKQEVITKTGLSMTKITNSLLSFESKELIQPALKVKNAKSYILTESGMKELLNLKGMI